MESNTYPKRPEWLTDEQIEKFRKTLRECPNPYTDEDVKHWVYGGDVFDFDSPMDIRRSNAHTAKRILSKYGLLEDEKKE